MGAVISLISSRGFIAVNKHLAKMYGLDEAILLGELASEYEYWETRGGIEDGYFYSTVENVQENTTLSDRRQRAAIKTLKDAGILRAKVKGQPPKRYFAIDENRLMAELKLANAQNQFLQNERIENGKTQELNLAKRKGNNNKPNKNKGNKNKNYKDIYVEIVSYLNEKAGTAYRATTKATQQHINARLSEGFTVEDFFKVIDSRCAEWMGDPKMAQYLRPSTLFGPKFENYLNTPTGKPPKGGGQFDNLPGMQII